MDKEQLEKLLRDWYQDHFGNYTPGTEVHAQHEKALVDLRDRFGLLDKPDYKPQQED